MSGRRRTSAIQAVRPVAVADVEKQEEEKEEEEETR